MNLWSILLQATPEVAETGIELPPVEETLSIFKLIVDAGWYIMIPLGILSIVAVFIFIERMLAIKVAAKEDDNFMNLIKDHIHEGKIDAAKSLCDTTNTPISRMIKKGVTRIGKPIDDVTQNIENAGKLEVYKMEKGLSTLATIAGAAPMIGFLGTVIGMVVTFHSIKIQGNPEIGELSGGIMQAMVTTVAGLVIGIMAYITYNFLVARVDNVVHRMEANSIEFIDLLNAPGK